MASIIRVGQSKFVSVPIDEDSNERIMNCIQTLSELNVAQTEKAVREAFLDDTKEAYTRMLGAQEVSCAWCSCMRRSPAYTDNVETRCGEEAG
jgi:coatomer subunit beta